MSSHISVSDLAKILEISLDDVKFSASDTNRDKVYELLMLWMSAHTTSAENSMAKLLTHLGERWNNASLIKKYRDGKSKLQLILMVLRSYRVNSISPLASR